MSILVVMFHDQHTSCHFNSDKGWEKTADQLFIPDFVSEFSIQTKTDYNSWFFPLPFSSLSDI